MSPDAPLVGILVGSESDRERMQPALDLLDERGVDYEFEVRSAHRTPDAVAEYARSARERGVEHVGRGEAVVEPAAVLAEPLGDRVDERCDVVVRARLDLGNAFGCRRPRARADLCDGFGRDFARLRPRFERCELDVEPARELVLVRPDPGHGRARIAGDHCRQSRGE